MLNNCKETEDSRYYSLLWPREADWAYWNSKCAASGSYIKDLCIGKILDSLAFKEEDRKKAEELFEKLCTDRSVLQYRLDIMEDFIENRELSEAFNEFVKIIALIERSSKEKYPNQKEIHVYTCLFEKAAAYVSLIAGMKECLESREGELKSSGLRALLDFVRHIAKKSIFIDMQKAVRRISEEYETVSKLSIEFGYYEGLKDIVINTDSIEGCISHAKPFISSILDNGAVFLDGRDRSYCKIYYDVRFSRLEELILERLMAVNPLVFNSIQEFYGNYSGYSFDEICELKFELEFYLRFSELVWSMENRGLKLCKPRIHMSQSGNASVLELYDLSLALQMKDSGRMNLSEAIVANDLSFDENGRIFVVTGPNKGGKTTYIRSVGIAQALFQAGCYVPAHNAEMNVVDAIHTHFPQEEVLGLQKGRLGEEIQRISQILDNSTHQSLILLNETFSSTRRVDGYYLGRDVLKLLMKKGCLGIYVTHFTELAFDVDDLNGEVPEGSKLASLAAGIDDFDGKGLIGNRTYRIHRLKPTGFGYSRDITLKHGLSSKQLDELLKRRGYLV
ncbi:MutS-related protein [Pseudobacteroides cellulosolvens]|uniref:DNA mismatch repair protein MutS domain protein n=1 Tax=Pseudobacteroides cellulosolvens ATCC 35603 = DSM 2933 TaxID=398512 RepID=A0A0L6JT57_9FIRM|nr:DNA mismatch repair protein MutS [Pseudobacteroides cellulosolvens]KNY28870.1 DNA mismatch repair protein MutS domain protein [Pseudobacteroides cellulosolvens ATCC 35603 = DSM 2933]